MNALEQDLDHGGEVVPPSYFREIYKGTLMLNGGYDKERAAEAIRTGSADLIAFGKLFIGAVAGTSGRLEANYQGGAGQRRANISSALACWTHISSEPST